MFPAHHICNTSMHLKTTESSKHIQKLNILSPHRCNRESAWKIVPCFLRRIDVQPVPSSIMFFPFGRTNCNPATHTMSFAFPAKVHIGQTQPFLCRIRFPYQIRSDQLNQCLQWILVTIQRIREGQRGNGEKQQETKHQSPKQN